MREEQLLTGELEPTNEGYALAKIAGMKLCEYLNLIHDFDAFTLMPCNLYGPGDNFSSDKSHVLAALIMKFMSAKLQKEQFVTCWGTGKPYREFLHVEDFAEASIYALENWDPKSTNITLNNSQKRLSFLNVGSGFDITIFNLANKISNLVGFQGDIIWDKTKKDGMTRKLMDSSRFKALGWSPRYSLDEGIKSVINYIQFHKLITLN